MAHPPEVGGVGLERGGDGAFEGDGAVGVEQLDESAGEYAEVVVALRSGDEQRLGRGGGVVEAVGGAVLAGGALAAFELFDMGGVFDLLAAVERARMGVASTTPASRMRTVLSVAETVRERPTWWWGME